MAKINRKQFLFDKFSGQLNLLKENGLIDIELKFDKTYICPLCLDQFCQEDLEVDDTKNYLTEEDAPPASLGGSRIALTCKKCNSECGHQIDYQLKLLIENEENSSFVEGVSQRGTIDFNSYPITVELISNGAGKLQAIHHENLNNPKWLKKFIEFLGRGKTIFFKPKKTKLDHRKVTYAFFKTNYIITFSKFGYIFLLDSAYDNLRKQILNSNDEIIKFNLAISNPHLTNQVGTYYVLNTGIKSILNVFNLRTALTTKTFAVFLPIPKITIESFVQEMQKKIVNQIGNFGTNLYDPHANLFTDLNEINKVKNWIDDVFI